MYRKGFVYKVAKKCEKPGDSSFWRMMNSLFSECMIQIGLVLYRRYRKRDSGRELLFIPSTDSGDLLFLRYSYSYIKEIYGEDAVLFIDERNKRIAEILDFPEIRTVSQMQMVPLAKAYYYHCNTKMKHLHDVYSWCFFDMRDTTERYVRDIPLYKVDQKAVDELFLKNGLRRGKTVVLAPYEQAITEAGMELVPGEVWEELARALQQEGYDVCTNCKGDINEPVVRGTKGVFPKLGDLEYFVESAGCYVAIRSGFCDFVNHTNARKVVLYPNDKYYKHFSMTNFGKNEGLMEFVYGSMTTKAEWDDRIQDIVNFCGE